MFEKDTAMAAGPVASAARRAPRWRGVAREAWVPPWPVANYRPNPAPRRPDQPLPRLPIERVNQTQLLSMLVDMNHS